MKWLDNFIQRCYNRARERDEDQSIMLDDRHKRKGRGRPVAVNRRVEHNYDDESVINFKVIGANGGMIVETTRYDEKRDTESIRRYVINEDADIADSLGRIVTTEYLR